MTILIKGRIYIMKLTKKVTAMAMASCMILSMTACGGSKPAETTAAATEAATTEAAKEAETTAAEVKEAAGGDFSDKKVGISIYKFDDIRVHDIFDDDYVFARNRRRAVFDKLDFARRDRAFAVTRNRDEVNLRVDVVFADFPDKVGEKHKRPA